MTKIITEYYWVLFILGIIAGIFLSPLALIAPYISYMMMFVLFLNFLKININDIFEKIKNLKLIIYLVFLALIITPVLVYLIFNIFLEPEYGLAILILAAMPAGMTIPVYTTLFKGDNELAVVIVVITSLLCPLTIPFLIHFLAGIQTNINLIQMFISLCIVIFIPLLSAMLFRKIAKKIINNTEKYYSLISILVITFIIACAIGKVNFRYLIKNESIIYPFFLLFVLAILLHSIGYYALYKRNSKTKITSSLAVAYMNSTLAIIFAAQFFSPKTLLLVTLYQIPTNLVLIGFGFFAKKYFYSGINA